MPPEPERRFSEEEVRAVLGRAIERQEAARRAAGPADGLTLADLRHVADEVGIDPRYIEAAVAELDHRPAAHPSNLYLGGPTEITVERVVEGRLAEEDVAPLVEKLRSTYKPKDRGRIEALAGTVEWTGMADDTSDPLYFTLMPEGSRTRLTLRRTLTNSATLLHIWSPMLAFFGLLPLLAPDGSPLVGIFLIVAAVVLYGVGRAGFGWLTRRSEEKMRATMNELEAMATAAVARTEAAAEAAPTAPQLDLDEESAESPERAPASQRRSIR